MKIPKYIESLLVAQQKSAERANVANVEIHKWLRKKGIMLDGTDIFCENSIMLITEPKAYADGIRRIIKGEEE